MSTESFIPNGVWVPRAIIGIASRYAVPLYLEIRKHCFETPECFPGVRRLAQLVGCSIGTVSALTDQFDALGVIRKVHTGRHCVYRIAEGCWRRRKPRHARKSAHRSVQRTEDRGSVTTSIDRAQNHENHRVSQETREKRRNLIKTLRRWVQLSPALPDGERGHRLAMLDRAEAALDNWHARPAEDRRCFDLLVSRVRAMPLVGTVVDSLRQAPIGMQAIGACLPAFCRMPACP